MFIFRKKNIIIISVLLITFFTFILCFGALSSKPIDDVSVKIIKVVLDAGHGGIDGGVVGVNSGVKESQLNLSVVKKLEAYFKSAGVKVKLTRNSDAGLYGVATKNLKRKDMEKRRDIIKEFEPNIVISVHMNKYNVSTRRGAQVFYKANDEKAKILASSIQKSFNKMPSASRECSILTGDYYLLNCTDYPSVIAECGFLSNPEDEALLLTEDYQNEIAYSIFKGVVEYFSITTSEFNN